MDIKYSYLLVLLVGFALTAQTAYAQDVHYVLAANITAATKAAVTELTNGTLVANPPPTNSTTGMPGNMTDPVVPELNLTTSGHSKWDNQTGSPAWKSGYLHGYEYMGINGTHTKEFFWGYTNGTLDLWFNRGYACGWSARHCPAPIYDSLQGKLQNQFYGGNHTGWLDRINAQDETRYDYPISWNDKLNTDLLKYTTLPARSNDHYWQYFIGFHNGKKVESDQYENGVHYIHPWLNECPSGTKEYCAGYAAGWNYQYAQDSQD